MTFQEYLQKLSWEHTDRRIDVLTLSTILERFKTLYTVQKFNATFKL